MNTWLTDTASWGALVGIVLPLLIAAVNQPGWSGTARRVVAAVAAVIAGVLTALANGQINDGQSVFATIVLILVTSQALYATLLRTPAKSIEAATSPRHLAE